MRHARESSITVAECVNIKQKKMRSNHGILLKQFAFELTCKTGMQFVNTLMISLKDPLPHLKVGPACTDVQEEGLQLAIYRERSMGEVDMQS